MPPLRSDGTSEWWSVGSPRAGEAPTIYHAARPCTADEVRAEIERRGFLRPSSWKLSPLDDGTEEPGVMYGVRAR